MPFLRGGRHLWTHFSQSFFDKNEEFLCLSERKFPELFQTHPTFVYSPLLGPSMACQTQTGVFFETPCISICKKVFMKLLKTYFHFSWPGLPRHPDPGAVPRVAPGPPALSLHPAPFYPNSDNILINILSLSDCPPEVCGWCQMYTIYIRM